MGLSLVRAALWQTSATLSYPADKILTVMASYAVDADPEPWYMGGWEPLAAALKLNGKAATNQRRVAEYLAELHRAGFITRIQSGTRGGGRARYRLWLPDPAPMQVDGTHPNCHRCPKGAC
jgi:hypothetical protein